MNKMSRLEFTKFNNIEEMKEALNALVKGEDYLVQYEKEGETKTKVLCRNKRLYLGNNYSISLSINDDKVYLGIDYYGADDRIKVNKNSSTPTTTDVF